jgi:nicotinate-nucleotide adenylyltransferase
MPGPKQERARVGVFGGTFDPIHTGHLIVATELQHALNLDRVLFVPTGNPPHKANQEVSPNEDRLAMLELAIAGNSSFAVSTLELERSGPSYTADLLAMLQAEMPEAQLVFLMGEDSLRDLPTWHRPESIVALAELGVAIRPDIETDLEDIYRQLPGARDRITIVSTTLIGISSSALRRRVREGGPIRYQVPAAVEKYIMTTAIYGVPAARSAHP